MFSAQGACTAAPVTFQPTMRASRIGVHDRVLNAPLLNHTMLMTAMLGLPGSIAPDKYISSPALVVPERSNWMRWVRENYAGIGSLVNHAALVQAYALPGLPSIVTSPLGWLSRLNCPPS